MAIQKTDTKQQRPTVMVSDRDEQPSDTTTRNRYVNPACSNATMTRDSDELGKTMLFIVAVSTASHRNVTTSPSASNEPMRKQRQKDCTILIFVLTSLETGLKKNETFDYCTNHLHQD